MDSPVATDGAVASAQDQDSISLNGCVYCQRPVLPQFRRSYPSAYFLLDLGRPHVLQFEKRNSKYSNKCRYEAPRLLRHDQYILRHSNGLRMVGIADSSFLCSLPDSAITGISFNIGGQDRLAQIRCSARKKRHGLNVNPGTVLAEVSVLLPATHPTWTEVLRARAASGHVTSETCTADGSISLKIPIYACCVGTVIDINPSLRVGDGTPLAEAVKALRSDPFGSGCVAFLMPPSQMKRRRDESCDAVISQARRPAATGDLSAHCQNIHGDVLQDAAAASDRVSPQKSAVTSGGVAANGDEACAPCPVAGHEEMMWGTMARAICTSWTQYLDIRGDCITLPYTQHLLRCRGGREEKAGIEAVESVEE